MTENALKCHTCGREWPIETSAPGPGTWDFSSGEMPSGGGAWTRDYLKKDEFDGEAKFSDWYFIGPCCELRYSGPDYQDEEDDEYLEELRYWGDYYYDDEEDEM